MGAWHVSGTWDLFDSLGGMSPYVMSYGEFTHL